MKTNLCIALMTATLFGFGTSVAQAQDAQEAVQTIESVYSKVYSAGTSSLDEASARAAYCDIATAVNYPGLVEDITGRFYTEAKPEHQTRFCKAMQGMLTSLFGQNFSSINFQRAFEVSPRVIKKSNGDVQVQTKLPFGETDVTNINFVMRPNAQGQWGIVDALIKGGSLQSQKYPEFKTALDRLKQKYLDPLNQYAIELEASYSACQ